VLENCLRRTGPWQWCGATKGVVGDGVGIDGEWYAIGANTDNMGAGRGKEYCLTL
jgi:hypothetical protein